MSDPYTDLTSGDSDRAPRERIRSNIAMQFLRGGVFACSVVFGPILFIYVVYLMGTLLPPDSKEAQDPTPDSFISSSEES